MNKIRSSITYSPTQNSEQDITVSRVTPDQIERAAKHIQAVLLASYTRAFETQQQVVNDGDIHRYLFNPYDKKRVTRQVERMRNYMATGSVYWLASHVRDAHEMSVEEVVGVAKTSPSRANKLKPWQKNCFLNDVDASVESTGIGSALMYAALGEYKDNRRVILNAFEGNDIANSWFERLGFEKQTEELDVFEIGPHKIPQIRYEAIAVGGVRAALLQSQPWLADGQAQ